MLTKMPLLPGQLLQRLFPVSSDLLYNCYATIPAMKRTPETAFLQNSENESNNMRDGVCVALGHKLPLSASQLIEYSSLYNDMGYRYLYFNLNATDILGANNYKWATQLLNRLSETEGGGDFSRTDLIFHLMLTGNEAYLTSILKTWTDRSLRSNNLSLKGVVIDRTIMFDNRQLRHITAKVAKLSIHSPLQVYGLSNMAADENCNREDILMLDLNCSYKTEKASESFFSPEKGFSMSTIQAADRNGVDSSNGYDKYKTALNWFIDYIKTE